MPKEKTKDEKDTTIKKKPSIDWKSRNMILGSSVALAVLISLAAYFFVVSPQWSKVGPGMEIDVDSVDKSLNERRAYYDQLKKMKDNYDGIDSENVELLSRILPTDVSVPEILSQLEVMARQSGVGLVSVNVAEAKEEDSRTARQRLAAQAGQGQAPTKSKEIREVNIQLEVSAFSYATHKRFIEALQSHVRIMDIEEFAYNTENDTHSIRVKTYFIEI